MVEHTRTLKTGDGMEDGNYMGPIQNAMQYEKVKGFFADIEKENLKVAVGGVNEEKPGYFITPTILDRPADTARITVDEPFGEFCTSFSICAAVILSPQFIDKCFLVLLGQYLISCVSPYRTNRSSDVVEG